MQRSAFRSSIFKSQVTFTSSFKFRNTIVEKKVNLKNNMSIYRAEVNYSENIIGEIRANVKDELHFKQSLDEDLVAWLLRSL